MPRPVAVTARPQNAEFAPGGQSAVVVEERTIRRVEIEEIVEFEPDEPNAPVKTGRSGISPGARKTLPAAPAASRFSVVWIVPAVLLFAALTFVAYRGHSSAGETKVLLAKKTVPFSGLPGRENSPAFSPDGRQLAFAWDGGVENGNLDVYVKLVGAGEPVRLTSGEADEINPVFSPDGKSIAFVRVSPARSEIVLIPALGGAERKIHGRAGYASLSFSPDGKLLAAAELGAAGDEAGILTINLQTGGKNRLTTPDAPAVDHTPRFSPDGRFVAFDVQNAGNSDVYIVPVNGGGARRLTENAKDNGLPAWSADGAWIFFNSNRSGDGQIRKMPASGGEAVQITEGGAFEMFAAPDGRSVIYSKGAEKAGLWSVSTTGGGEQPIPELAEAGARRSWTIAANGVFYTAFAPQTPLDVKFYDFKNKQTRRVAVVDKSPLAYYASLAVAPDGNRILYARRDETSASITLADLAE